MLAATGQQKGRVGLYRVLAGHGAICQEGV